MGNHVWTFGWWKNFDFMLPLEVKGQGQSQALKTLKAKFKPSKFRSQTTQSFKNFKCILFKDKIINLIGI